MPALFAVIVTAAGTWVASWLQERSWNHEQQEKLRETELQSATALFERVSNDMDERLWVMKKYYWSLTRSEEDPRHDQRWQDVEDALDEWNKKRDSDFARMERALGTHIADTFENEINKRFKDLAILLFEVRTGEVEDPAATEFEEMARELGGILRSFNIDVIRALQHQRAGIFADRSAGQ